MSATPTDISLLRLATAGSVDDGKSTLVGRLLHDCKAVFADQLDAVERVSRERGIGRRSKCCTGRNLARSVGRHQKYPSRFFFSIEAAES